MEATPTGRIWASSRSAPLLQGPCRFRVKACTKPGDRIFLVGHGDLLGNWKLDKGLPLHTSDDTFPEWTSDEIVLPAGTFFYKYIIKHPDQHYTWEPTDHNRQVVRRNSCRGVLVNDGEFSLLPPNGMGTPSIMPLSMQVAGKPVTWKSESKADLLKEVKAMVETELEAFRSELGQMHTAGSESLSSNWPSPPSGGRILWSSEWVKLADYRDNMDTIKLEFTDLKTQVNALEKSLRQELVDLRGIVHMKLSDSEKDIQDNLSKLDSALSKLQDDFSSAVQEKSEVSENLARLQTQVGQQQKTNEREVVALRHELDDIRDSLLAVRSSEIDVAMTLGVEASEPKLGRTDCLPVEETPVSANGNSEEKSEELGPSAKMEVSATQSNGQLQSELCHGECPVEWIPVEASEDLRHPFFTSPPHPELPSKKITLEVEDEILESLRRNDPAEKKAKLMKRLQLKVHPDKGGTAEATIWFRAWKEKHLEWFLGEGFIDWLEELL